jgi:hypothetical protein
VWLVAAAVWGLAEATLFFVVPDVLLTWLAAFRPRVACKAVVACLAGALAGGSRRPGTMDAVGRRLEYRVSGVLLRNGLVSA